MHTVLLVLKQMMSYCYKIIPQNTNGTSKSRQKSPLTKTQNVIYLMHFIHSFLSVSSDADIRQTLCFPAQIVSQKRVEIKAHSKISSTCSTYKHKTLNFVSKRPFKTNAKWAWSSEYRDCRRQEIWAWIKQLTNSNNT